MNVLFFENGPGVAVNAGAFMPSFYEEQGIRLRIAREMIREGCTLIQAADLFGENDQTWNRWELGRTKMPSEMAWKIQAKFPIIERDWLLFGEERFLNPAQSDAIAEAKRRLAEREPSKERLRA